MPNFITEDFLETVRQNGRLIDALRNLDILPDSEKAKIPRLPKLSSWECVLEEVLDTDHDPPYYDRFVNELLCRGYREQEILEMRIIAWETAGWLNFEMMVWDWCSLNENDMRKGLKNRFESGNINKQRYEELASKIEKYGKTPKQTLRP